MLPIIIATIAIIMIIAIGLSSKTPATTPDVTTTSSTPAATTTVSTPVATTEVSTPAATTTVSTPVVTTTVSTPVVEKVVVFYSDCDYKGNTASLKPGKYDMSSLIAAGIANDSLSSLKIPAGLTVILYEHNNFSGKQLELTSDVSCLISKDFNDFTSSVEVKQVL